MRGEGFRRQAAWKVPRLPHESYRRDEASKARMKRMNGRKQMGWNSPCRNTGLLIRLRLAEHEEID